MAANPGIFSRASRLPPFSKTSSSNFLCLSSSETLLGEWASGTGASSPGSLETRVGVDAERAVAASCDLDIVLSNTDLSSFDLVNCSGSWEVGRDEGAGGADGGSRAGNETVGGIINGPRPPGSGSSAGGGCAATGLDLKDDSFGSVAAGDETSFLDSCCVGLDLNDDSFGGPAGGEESSLLAAACAGLDLKDDSFGSDAGVEGSSFLASVGAGLDLKDDSFGSGAGLEGSLVTCPGAGLDLKDDSFGTPAGGENCSFLTLSWAGLDLKSDSRGGRGCASFDSSAGLAEMDSLVSSVVQKLFIMRSMASLRRLSTVEGSSTTVTSPELQLRSSSSDGSSSDTASSSVVDSLLIPLVSSSVGSSEVVALAALLVFPSCGVAPECSDIVVVWCTCGLQMC